ncbi:MULTISPECIES: phage protease [unclassified Bradyrhizobium]|uniref:phage protease n=1 Tax=unclassified Bradyrhizobium TaxID=2631580 RepID=UPI0028F102EB|nr:MULTISPECIES: phage protease [unclassified Bradyrhizobium]
MSGKHTSKAFETVHGAGVEISFNAQGAAAPEWIMLLPIGQGGVVATVDGRGPYRVLDANKLAAQAQALHAGRIPIDENHATDLAAPEGRPAPARGWATQLEVRADGIYGRVEWSEPGAALLAERAYRFISPVLIHDKTGAVLDMPRASLTNTPNLRGMAALNSQQENDPMDLLAQLRKLLGLADDADAEAVMTKVKSMCGTDTSMNAIATAAGLKAGATGAQIVEAVAALSTASSREAATTISALQSEVRELGTRLATVTSTAAHERATAFIDNAIREGRVGVKPMRDHYISRHAASAEAAADVEKEIGAMPKLGPSVVPPGTPPEVKDGKVALNADQRKIVSLLGISEDDYAKTLAADLAVTET